MVTVRSLNVALKGILGKVRSPNNIALVRYSLAQTLNARFLHHLKFPRSLFTE